jgi:hypothetical protein
MTFKNELKLIANESKVNRSAEDFLPSIILPQICRHIRGHKSIGEKNFLTKWLEPSFVKLGLDWTTDMFGNYYVQIKGSQMERVLHVGHLDTVSSAANLNKYQRVIIDKDNFMTLDYKHYETVKGGTPSCLGTDDGSAIAVMLSLMANGVSGTYLFTRGEEVGCLGAKYVVDNFPEFLDKFEIALEVDRAGTEELICEQSTGKCASGLFTTSLAKGLGMNHKASDRGVITDVGQFNEHIQESINIAAGYENQHGDQEVQDMTYIEVLAKQMIKLDYAELVVVRKVTDMGDYGWGGYGNFSQSSSLHRSNYWDDYDYNSTPTKKKKPRKSSKAAKGICPKLLAQDPALESGLSLDNLTIEEVEDLYQNGVDSDWYFTLNAAARVEIMQHDHPLITGVTCDKLSYIDLVDYVHADPEAFAKYFQDKKLDLEVVGASDFLHDIQDIYKGEC